MSNSSFTISTPSSILAKNKFQELVKINDRIAIGHMITRLLLNVFLISLMIYMSQKGFYVALIEFGLPIVLSFIFGDMLV